MKKTRYSEEQIAFALKQAETGARVGEVCRKMCCFTGLFTPCVAMLTKHLKKRLKLK